MSLKISGYLVAVLLTLAPEVSPAREAERVDAAAMRKTTVSSQEPPPIAFRLATEILSPGQVQLANGITVQAADWPNLILARMPQSARSKKKISTCSATMIGPNVVLTAAHCVDNPTSTLPRKAILSLDGG